MTQSPTPRILVAGAIMTLMLYSQAHAQATATGILLDQAAFWQSQNRPDQAIASLVRVLAFDPINADALAMLGQIQAGEGQSDAARTVLERLRASHPDDPRIVSLGHRLGIEPSDPEPQAPVAPSPADLRLQAQLDAAVLAPPPLAPTTEPAPAAPPALAIAAPDSATPRRAALRDSGRALASQGRRVARSRAGRQRDAVQVALAAAKTHTGEQRLASDPAGLADTERRHYENLQNSLAIETSDAWNRAGDQASGYEALAKRLTAQPAATDLNLALERLYRAAHRPREALRIDEALLSQTPNDLDVRRAAVGAAVQAGDVGRAQAMVAEAIRTAPRDPRTYMMSADLAQARGDDGQALSDLRRARALLLHQTGAMPDRAEN